MVDAMVERIEKEVEFETRCVATGGLAHLFAEPASKIEAVDPLLTLKGTKNIV